ncbi:metallophosphoesterase family protein [Zavarzinella formosa]|uniref:metallophosphoesterase family protein n=1 Tax=Zavarzinella formosa TaxID=360055 RepID=UPI0002FC41CA|nr:metallophosphoesterase family protein [Zavarzinella formosa]
MKAILGDIDGNLEALKAVLADIERQGVDSVCNLGDTLGYGPNPVECLDLAMRMSVVLLGAFDHAVLFGSESPRSGEDHLLWTQTQLETIGEPADQQRRRAFLSGLSSLHRDGNILCVHGSPRDPLREYVFPEDVYNLRKMSQIGAAFDRLCFVGKTHIPGVFIERSPDGWEFVQPEECDQGFHVVGHKLICNVGSVGQPRDGDPRPCYALFDGERIWFRRVD